MARPTPNVDPSVYFIADHLDAVLAAGEDVCRLVLPPHGGAPTTDARTVMERVRAFEMTIVVRALQARLRCIELRRADPRFQPMVDLFIGGTARLLDVIEEYGDASAIDFATGDDIVAYLRERAVLAPDAAAPQQYAALRIGPGLRIAGQIELGPLMDMCASFLDSLEFHYRLYAEAPAAMAPAA